MQVQNSYNYIQIGLALRLLRNVSVSSAKNNTIETIKTLTIGLQNGGFEVSMASTESETFVKMESSLNSEASTEKLNEELVSIIKEEFSLLEHVVFSEALTKKIYTLPSRRFNTEFLLNSPSKLLKLDTFDKLDNVAQSDISSACRCILFGEATAVAFHILRATESVLKSYYFHHKKQHRLTKPMWGSMIDQLRAKTKNKPPEKLLDALDNIRNNYRNPTQHPEAIYDIDSAQDLFGVCLDAIGKMADELLNTCSKITKP